MNIVVVEDDTLIRDNLCEFLEIEGFTVVAATNGQEGLSAIEELNGDCLVLLDLQMPVMTGEQMLTALQLHVRTELREVPVIVLTARNEPLKHPVKALIRKPYGLSQLLQTIQEIVKAAPLTR